MAALLLSTLLSQVVIAFTIELDNEFERRFQVAGGGRTLGTGRGASPRCAPEPERSGRARTVWSQPLAETAGAPGEGGERGGE